MYSTDQLNSLPGEGCFQLLVETHKSLVAMLWAVDELRKFEPYAVECHFDDQCHFFRAQEGHRILMAHTPKQILEKGFLNEGKKEFQDWCYRCCVGR